MGRHLVFTYQSNNTKKLDEVIVREMKRQVIAYLVKKAIEKAYSDLDITLSFSHFFD